MTYGLLALLAGVFLAANAFAAPDEEALGKAEGYPVCPPWMRNETRCLVGLVSRFDEVFPARKVARGVQARSLMLADSKSKVVMVHTAAGAVGGPGIGEIIALWFGVVETFGK